MQKCVGATRVGIHAPVTLKKRVSWNAETFSYILLRVIAKVATSIFLLTSYLCHVHPPLHMRVFYLLSLSWFFRSTLPFLPLSQFSPLSFPLACKLLCIAVVRCTYPENSKFQKATHSEHRSVLSLCLSFSHAGNIGRDARCLRIYCYFSIWVEPEIPVAHLGLQDSLVDQPKSPGRKTAAGQKIGRQPSRDAAGTTTTTNDDFPIFLECKVEINKESGELKLFVNILSPIFSNTFYTNISLVRKYSSLNPYWHTWGKTKC